MAKTYYQENGQLHPLEIVTAVTGGPTPPAINNVMVVTAADAGGGTFKADKTAAEIANAEAADKIIELRYNTDRYQFVGMVGENESQAAQFDRIGVSETDIDQLTIFIDLEGNIRTENSLYEHDITLGIMGAAIGKAAVVRSIDDAGHPTSWGLESIPGAYRLPHASAGSLGGVKADPKTDEDTQPVHIGEDNKLYTKPGTDGGNFTELWKNQNPNVTFPQKTITFTGNWRLFLITCRVDSDLGHSTELQSFLLPIGKTTLRYMGIEYGADAWAAFSRDVDIKANSCFFYSGYIAPLSNTIYSKDDHFLVPVEIYGIV